MALEGLLDFIRPDSHILDVGSGSGYLTTCFAKMVSQFLWLIFFLFKPSKSLSIVSDRTKRQSHWNWTHWSACRSVGEKRAETQCWLTGQWSNHICCRRRSKRISTRGSLRCYSCWSSSAGASTSSMLI